LRSQTLHFVPLAKSYNFRTKPSERHPHILRRQSLSLEISRNKEIAA
jgi:hypothetical protein